ncbi:MAG: ATP-binding cassette domain-containing protein, partial [Calditrichaeota bacterium]|nr:ATP-binding cassette domain-containing protein [Calditrichota bacterium]
MITITGLQKRFGKLAVLRGIDLNIAPGKVTAIVGPNGSGKTTLIKTLLGLVRPDSGTISLAGVSLNGDPSYREMIGYMPQAGKFPENLTVSEVLRLVKDVRRHSGPLDEALFEQFQ